jgi:serine-type D-Ala-D-Ala carboxypeptidase/endopeptidase
MKTPFFAILLLLTLPLSNSYAQINQKIKRGIEQAMAHEMDMDSAKVTGFVIGLFDHDSTWIFPYGRISKSEKTPMNSDVRFELGAASHPFLLSRLRQLATEKRLDLDKNVNFYLKTEQKFPLGEILTLRQLATHTSGLPKFPPDFGDFETDKTQPFADFTEGVFWDDLKSMDSTQLTKGKYLFSHLGVAILEKIVQPFGTLDREFLGDKNLAQGYNLAQNPVDNWQFNGVFDNTLGLKMSVSEVLNFVKKDLKTPEITEMRVSTGLNKYTFMGDTWHVIRHNKYLRICVATGMTGGHSTFIAFIPQTQTGVVILTNSRIIQGKLGYYILRMLNNNWKRKQ